MFFDNFVRAIKSRHEFGHPAIARAHIVTTSVSCSQHHLLTYRKLEVRSTGTVGVVALCGFCGQQGVVRV